MSFRSIVRDVRDGIGSLSRRGFEVRLMGHHRGKSHGSLNDLHDPPLVVQNSRWASLPPELLYDVIRRLEESESTWPSRKHVVACASVCRSWRMMCKEIVKSPEICGKLTFPVSLKQPGPRDGLVQCFIKRDKSNLTYHLYLCLSPALLVENGKFLLSAKRTRRTTCTEYVISMDADNISRSSNTYIGKLRSNFLGTKFIVYDTQPACTSEHITPPGRTSRRFTSKKVSPKVPTGSYNIAQITYELNVLGTRGPRRMHCMMHSIPVSSLDVGGTVPGQPELLSRSLEDSFRSISFSKSLDHSVEFSSARFSEIGGPRDDVEDSKTRPLVLKNKPPRWHEQLQCWCLNFRNSQKFFLSIDQPSSLPTTKTLLVALAFALFVFVLSLFALGSITYSVFHGFYGRPVKFISAVRSVKVSFWPVLGTVLASHIVFLLVVLVAGLFLFLVVGVFEMVGLEMEFASPYFVGLCFVVAISVLLVLLYLQVNWTLAGVVAVVEPRWGFNALSRSANLIQGMRGVALSLVLFFGALSGILGFCSTVSELGLDGATDGWRNWKSLAFVLQIVVFSTAHMLVLLYHAAANTVLYMYCKAVHGELALEIAQEFASEYVSLPFDDGKVPHLVSVAYVR